MKKDKSITAVEQQYFLAIKSVWFKFSIQFFYLQKLSPFIMKGSFRYSEVRFCEKKQNKQTIQLNKTKRIKGQKSFQILVEKPATIMFYWK